MVERVIPLPNDVLAPSVEPTYINPHPIIPPSKTIPEAPTDQPEFRTNVVTKRPKGKKNPAQPGQMGFELE